MVPELIRQSLPLLSLQFGREDRYQVITQGQCKRRAMKARLSSYDSIKLEKLI